ncbi:AMP-binding protein [Streptomyces sp. FR-108]|uniref:AMP-binding protein n=1 Tax=Streptomyces sp. FR-108 TaxID=3416665 RepID=UPI003CF83EA1
MALSDGLSDGPSEAHGAGNPGLPEGRPPRIHRQAAGTPRAVALIDDDMRLDYAAPDFSAAAVSQALRRGGVVPGQAVTPPGSWRLLCVMLGILRLGALVVSLDSRSPAELRRHIPEIRTSAAAANVVQNGRHTDGGTEAEPPLESTLHITEVAERR